MPDSIPKVQERALEGPKGPEVRVDLKIVSYVWYETSKRKMLFTFDGIEDFVDPYSREFN